MAHQLHFLLVPLMSQSHIIPLTDFANLLARQGAFVSIVTTPLNDVTHKSSIRSNPQKNLHIQTIPIEFPCREAGLPEGCENLDTVINSPELTRRFFRASQMLESRLEKLIGELEPKPDCIISTTAVSWIKKPAEKFNIPRYLFETISCFSLLCSHKLSLSKVQENAVSDSAKFLVPDIPHKIEFTKSQLPKTTSSEDSSDGNNFEEIKDLVKQARDSVKGILVNSFHELEHWYVEGYKRETGKVWCIGPVSLCNTPPFSGGGKNIMNKTFSVDCLTWLDQMKPNSVIYACFGSLCRISAQQIKEIGLGLEASNSPFIWVIRKYEDSCAAEVEEWLAAEDDGFEERVRGRGVVIRGWAPQVAILSHRSVGGFVTHCGWNSTLEGVCAGVQMVTWPMFAEQFYNEKFIVDVLGIGVRVGVDGCLDYSNNNNMVVKWDRVKNAIKKVMGTESEEEGNIIMKKRREKAEKLAKMAREAVEEGGSSFLNVSMFIRDVLHQLH
ncbi:hypothetical protein ACP275_12G147500 [Erythranthe tilingii]